MEDPKQYTIKKVISLIENDRIRIPLLSRPYVWNNEDVEDLFYAIFTKKFFGIITAIKQTETYEIFEHKCFKETSSDIFSGVIDKDNPLYLILDGHQRLKSIYNGIANGTLYFDLMYDGLNRKPFRFFDNCPDVNKWIPVKDLYDTLTSPNQSYSNISSEYDYIGKENVFKFYCTFFYYKNIFVSELIPDGIDKVSEDRKRFKRLFLSLNTFGGVKEEENLYDDNYNTRTIALTKIRKIGNFFLDNPNHPNNRFGFNVQFYDDWAKTLYDFVVKCIKIEDEKIYLVMESYLKLFYFTGINMRDDYEDLFESLYKKTSENLKDVLCKYFIENKIQIKGIEFDDNTKSIMAYHCMIQMMKDFDYHISKNNHISFIQQSYLYENSNIINFPFLQIDGKDPLIWMDLDNFQLKSLEQTFNAFQTILMHTEYKTEKQKAYISISQCNSLFLKNEKQFSNIQEIESLLYKKLDELWSKKEKEWNDYFIKLKQ